MSFSNAAPAINTLLKFGDGAMSETFTTVAEVRSLTGPQMSANMVDVTNHSSGDPWMEKIATLRDAGTISFLINFNHSDPTHDHNTGVLYVFSNALRRHMKIILPDNTELLSFSGYVSKVNFNFAVAGVQEATIDITIVGKPTILGS